MSWIREQFTFADLQRLLFRLSEHVRAFQGLTPAEISDLLGSSEKCSFAPGAYIVKEGNVGAHMYIILSGEARVIKEGREGAVELARLAPADSFGEILFKGSHDAEEVTVVSLDLTRSNATRMHWPFLRDRRIDAYQDITRRYIDDPK